MAFSAQGFGSSAKESPFNEQNINHPNHLSWINRNQAWRNDKDKFKIWREKQSKKHTGKIGYWLNKKRPEMVINAKNNPNYGMRGKPAWNRLTIEERIMRGFLLLEKKQKIKQSWNKGKKGFMPEPWNKGKHWSEEIKNKLKKNHWSKKEGYVHPNKGKIVSDERRKKQSESAKNNPYYGMGGKKHTKVMKENMSKIRKGENNPMYGIRGEKNPRYGLHHSQKTKEILSKKSKGKNYFERYGLETASRMIAMRLNRVYPKKDTKPECMIMDELVKRNIIFEKHKSILNVCQTDQFISPNICIFEDGDYWHCNPKKYKEPINQTQINNIRRDKKANTILTKNGYIVLRFWEQDIKNNLDECLYKIQEARGVVNG